MFCEKCGAKLEEDAVFCTKCGTKVGEAKTEKENNEKQEDKEIQLRVKPKFKFGYLVLPVLILYSIIILIVAAMINADGSGMGGIIGGSAFLILIVILGIKVAFNKAQYNHLTYDFYKTKVIFEDSFLNLSQKEVKYKYIREVTMRQTFIQRWFNIGNVILYTNAETGFGNGVSIINVEDVQKVYKEIKEIINV